jgi:hypothetical protein
VHGTPELMSTYLNLGFTKFAVDHNLYYLFDNFDLLVLALYVDDLILIISSKKLVPWCKTKLTREFDMKYIGLMHLFLGLEVWQGTTCYRSVCRTGLVA